MFASRRKLSWVAYLFTSHIFQVPFLGWISCVVLQSTHYRIGKSYLDRRDAPTPSARSPILASRTRLHTMRDVLPPFGIRWCQTLSQASILLIPLLNWWSQDPSLWVSTCFTPSTGRGLAACLEGARPSSPRLGRDLWAPSFESQFLWMNWPVTTPSEIYGHTAYKFYLLHVWVYLTHPTFFSFHASSVQSRSPRPKVR